MQDTETGTVKWFNNRKGYGFIERHTGDDVFVHYSQINAGGYRTLNDGQLVEYILIESDKGFQANDVTIVN